MNRFMELQKQCKSPLNKVKTLHLEWGRITWNDSHNLAPVSASLVLFLVAQMINILTDTIEYRQGQCVRDRSLITTFKLTIPDQRSKKKIRQLHK